MFNPSLLKAAYLNKTNIGNFTEMFLLLFMEAIKSFQNELPRASIITCGESLFRLNLEKIVSLLKLKGQLRYNKGKNSLNADKIFEDPTYLFDKLKLSLTINILQEYSEYDSEVIQLMHHIRLLRNQIVHSDFQYLSDWDPDNGRDNEEMIKLIKNEIDIPEAYKFELKDNNQIREVIFNCRSYNVSLKEYSTEMRFAAIQLFHMDKVLDKIFSSGA